MTSNEIRSSFLRYFEKNGHRVVASSPLVPADDPTLLFTNAGMNQFKDTFLGRERRAYTRAASSQKCMRVSGKHNDLDNVGPSLRHHTFFEMLGNFSFGDYFKADAIRYAWILLTEVWMLPPDRLVVSIFKGENGIPRDDEAYDVWRTLVPSERIMELGADDNFWQMGDTGPCGRCSEIYFVRGTGTDPEIEIWNNVFMEFNRGADGRLDPLPAPSIDTGMGLERITAVLQKKDSNYDTDLFTPLLRRIGELAGIRYGADRERDVSMRVVADHARATTFLIGDGVIPSNEFRGYVLRKIMRRAMRHGKHLGLTEPFLHRMVEVLVREMGEAYPELGRNREMIEKTILAEEHRFDTVLTDGLPRLESEIAKALERPERVLSGDIAFRLYDTFGIPYDFIEDTAATHDLRVDRAGYDRAMQGAARYRARQERVRRQPRARPNSSVGERSLAQGGDGPVRRLHARPAWPTCRCVALFDRSRQPIDAIGAGRDRVRGARANAVLPRGRWPGVRHRAAARRRGRQRRRSSKASAASVPVCRGRIRSASNRACSASATRSPRRSTPKLRDATRRNHTATHLLHAALRQVLGATRQAGGVARRARIVSASTSSTSSR